VDALRIAAKDPNRSGVAAVKFLLCFPGSANMTIDESSGAPQAKTNYQPSE
jgi:hypothetical protein